MCNIPRKDSYKIQIDKFYKGKLNRHDVISVAKTPEALLNFGAEQLPIILKQSILKKVIKVSNDAKSMSAHGISKELILNIPVLLETPVFIVNEFERQSLALISDIQDQNGFPLLIAIKLNSNVNDYDCNEIKSMYGKENLKAYLMKQKIENVTIVDMKRAKQLSRLARLQLPAAWKVLDYKRTLP